ncbi:MAG: phosphoglycerate dehydrogenase [Verrucomicrobiota bacterium]
MPESFNILVLDGVSQRGIDKLSESPNFNVTVEGKKTEEELLACIDGVHALIVRSATKVPRSVIEKADCLKVIGRAGVGVDNVDVKAATEKGIVVMNTPSGNTVSTAELAFSMMLSLSRNIPQAHGSMKAGRWDRKLYQGVEVNKKVVGIVGMGRIGTEFARRAFAFGMRVLAYDPYLSLSRARSLQVELFEDLDVMLAECDYVTLHIPMTKDTKGLINKNNLAKCKPDLRIINCARGGLVDEVDLYESLKSNQIAGAAFDVYTEEPPGENFPLRELDNFVMTPHLGASTAEAQESVGIEVAESVSDLLKNGTVRNAVNVPSVDSKTLETLKPYIELGNKLGLILSQLAPKRIASISVDYYGKIKDQDTTAVTRSAVKGYLQNIYKDSVNEINVTHFAETMGLSFSESRDAFEADYSELITVAVKTEDGQVRSISGTLFGTNPRIVRIHHFNLETTPEGVLLVLENVDKPGIIGLIGTLMAKHDINIASMSLARSEAGSHALSVLNLDSMPNDEVLEELLSDENIVTVKPVKIS